MMWLNSASACMSVDHQRGVRWAGSAGIAHFNVAVGKALHGRLSVTTNTQIYAALLITANRVI